MSTETKIAGKTKKEWENNFVHDAPFIFRNAAFAHVAELEAKNEFLKDQILNAHGKLADAELPFVMRVAPPDRPGWWRHDNGKRIVFREVWETEMLVRRGMHKTLATLYAGCPARVCDIPNLWGSAPLQVGKDEL
jgi:hypothetical protein